MAAAVLRCLALPNVVYSSYQRWAMNKMHLWLRRVKIHARLSRGIDAGRTGQSGCMVSNQLDNQKMSYMQSRPRELESRRPCCGSDSVVNRWPASGGSYLSANHGKLWGLWLHSLYQRYYCRYSSPNWGTIEWNLNYLRQNSLVTYQVALL